MKRLTPQEKQDQLNMLKRWIEKYTAEHPRNNGEYSWGMRENNLNDVQKILRDGIVFYSNGWGWRLRKNWREALDAAEQRNEAVGHGLKCFFCGGSGLAPFIGGFKVKCPYCQ